MTGPILIFLYLLFQSSQQLYEVETVTHCFTNEETEAERLGSLCEVTRLVLEVDLNLGSLAPKPALSMSSWRNK